MPELGISLCSNLKIVILEKIRYDTMLLANHNFNASGHYANYTLQTHL